MRRIAIIGGVAGLVLAAGVLGLSVPAMVQAEPQGVWRAAAEPAPPQQSMQQSLDVMGPVMGKMAESMMDSMMRVMEKPETAERLATFARNYYDALRKKGFSEETALRMVTAVGLPTVMGMK